MSVTEQPVTVAVHATKQRRRGWLLIAIAVWNVWLWATRINNLVTGTEDFSAAFIGVHTLLYLGSLGLAGVLAVLGVRMVREARASGERGDGT